MKKVFLSFFVLVICLTGNAQLKRTVVSDSAQIRSTVINFYKWYLANWKKLAAFKLYGGKSGKDAPPYTINWKEVEKYFAYIRTNVPYLSEAFIENERAIYKESEQEFKKNPEDEIPAGFDYDHFTNSQEDPQYLWQELIKKSNKWKIVVSPDGTAVVQVDTKEFPQIFCGRMKKEKSRWKIASTLCEEKNTTDQ
jgi:hypothetical protein